MNPRRTPLLGLLPPAALLLAWWLCGQSDWARQPLFATPTQVLQVLWQDARSGVLWSAVSASLGRYLAGLALGAAAGVLGGVLLGLSRWSRLLLHPTLRSLQQISLFAWIPLIMAWFGIAESSKIVFIALAAFFPVLINTDSGVRGVPRAYLEIGRVHGFSWPQAVWRIVIPAALPSVLSGLLLAVIYAWLATLGAEYLLTQGEGLGSLLVEGQEQYRTDTVVAGLSMVAAISLALHALVDRLQQHLLRWRAPATTG